MKAGPPEGPVTRIEWSTRAFLSRCSRRAASRQQLGRGVRKRSISAEQVNAQRIASATRHGRRRPSPGRRALRGRAQASANLFETATDRRPPLARLPRRTVRGMRLGPAPGRKGAGKGASEKPWRRPSDAGRANDGRLDVWTPSHRTPLQPGPKAIYLHRQRTLSRTIRSTGVCRWRSAPVPDVEWRPVHRAALTGRILC
jgi:hypothetical protein